MRWPWADDPLVRPRHPNSRPIRPERLPADERATGLMQAIEWNSTLPKTGGATGLFPSQDGSIQGPTAQGQPLTQNGNDMIGCFQRTRSHASWANYFPDGRHLP